MSSEPSNTAELLELFNHPWPTPDEARRFSELAERCLWAVRYLTALARHTDTPKEPPADKRMQWMDEGAAAVCRGADVSHPTAGH